MSSAPKQRYTVEEYLDFEAKSERKHEYYDGEIFAMAGASPEHITIIGNLARILGNQFFDQPCRFYTTDLRVKTKRDLYTYPDAAIVCDEPSFEGLKLKTLTNPLVLLEVLSDSTEHYDRTGKFRHYKTISSLREYVLISQDEARVEIFVKDSAGNWPQEPLLFTDIHSTVQLSSVPCQLKLTDLYHKVEFLPPDEIRRGNPRFDE